MPYIFTVVTKERVELGREEGRCELFKKFIWKWKKNRLEKEETTIKDNKEKTIA